MEVLVGEDLPHGMVLIGQQRGMESDEVILLDEECDMADYDVCLVMFVGATFGC